MSLTSPKSPRKDLIDLIHPELEGQTWTLPTDMLARALSAKQRKPDAGPLKTRVQKIPIRASHHFVNSNPTLLLDEPVERAFYPGLCNFLNRCVNSCATALRHHEPNRPVFLQRLEFFTWDKSMKDGIDEAEPLKPDLAGLFCNEAPSELYWSPPSGGTQMKIPVEVKSSWSDLVLQAGTYARSLFSAAPLRQYALVLGYNQKERVFRFLVFHRGGLTASHPLELDDAGDQKDLVRLFLSIFTWKDRGDAGLPRWCNENQACLPGTQDVEHFLVNIERLLYRSTCVRGRSTRVFGFKIPDTTKKDPLAATPLIPTTETVQCSQRIQENVGKAKGQGTGPLGSQGQLHSHSGTRSSRSKEVNSASNSPNSLIDKAKPITVSPDHRTKDTCITTNHLFLPPSHLDTEAMEEYRWHLYEKGDTERPDYRALLIQVMQDAGSSLVSAPDLQSLITAITHAHIGYYNMIQRSYQHRDVSIWNILTPNQLSECDIAFTIDQPTAVQKEILQLCKDLSIKKQHAAILIDADMAIDWTTYFVKAHGGTKSGTEAFMSRRLLNPALPDHIHSPLDDYWSFYFVAQWACVFNPLSLDGVQNRAPIQRWRALLDGSPSNRDTATADITQDPLNANQHGEFLRQAQPFLEAWNDSLRLLGRSWVDMPESLKREVFSDFADRGLLSFLKVAHKFLLPTSSTK
ncbi:hypothetical protein BDP27DRAFT_1455315 [Rhodocollybia butyracea]|uniref:Fungal-type protein kinase domain-containing protein n=1 Tax=Rhodocollybia butyracea TaxID=206335 RepID=A0A9P5TWI9_9AGAR|nr:hypothetical protein BDP27DRAFT_1455315 [Rhodocollybia butyracea]